MAYGSKTQKPALLKGDLRYIIEEIPRERLQPGKFYEFSLDERVFVEDDTDEFGYSSWAVSEKQSEHDGRPGLLSQWLGDTAYNAARKLTPPLVWENGAGHIARILFRQLEPAEDL